MESNYQQIDAQGDKKIIKLITLQMGNKAWQYSRVVNSLIDQVAQLGGVFTAMKFLFLVLYIYFGEPFKKLSLALAYSKFHRTKE